MLIISILLIKFYAFNLKEVLYKDENILVQPKSNLPELLLTKYNYNVYISHIFPFNSKYFDEFNFRYSFLKSIDFTKLNKTDFDEFAQRNIKFIIS